MATSDNEGARRASTFDFPYITCRNISGPEDEAAGRKVYAGHVPASSVLALEDNENVREYLVDAYGKAKARPTLVHQAIRKTLEKLLALMDKDATSKAFAYSQKTRCLKLFQRVVEGREEILGAARSHYGYSSETEVRAEIDPKTGKVRLSRLLLVVDQVEDDAVQITLEEGKRRNPVAEVGDYIAEALAPLEYGRNEDLVAIYGYFLDMAGSAWKLYEQWKAHPGFRGTRLRSIERENGEVANVPDGIVFPILGALSAFVNRNREGWWKFQPVERFDERELIDAAAQVYMEIADHNPQTMGKSKACYSALQRITAIYARLAA